jgi:predicted dehydrogenase
MIMTEAPGKKLKAGFIGFGRMGITHFSILNTNPLVEVVSVADTSKNMRNILNKYIKVKTYSDYRQMISESQLDFIIISTPTDSHAEVIRHSLDNGLHVFTEKPLAMTPKESEGIIKQLEGKNIVNQVGYVNRFNEVFMEVKSLLERNTIGELKSFTSEMYGATVLKGAGSSWRSKHKTGGGCMYEFASHCIDLVLYFLGLPDKVAGSVLKSIYSTGVEDMVTSSLIYNNGVSGTITVNWSDESYRKPTNIVTFFGTKGRIVADKHAYKIYLKEDNPKNGFQKGWNTRYITDFAKSVRVYLRGNEFTRQLDSFVSAIANGEHDTLSGFKDAYQTDLLMEKIRLDAQSIESSESSQNTVQTKSEVTYYNKSKESFWKTILERLGLNNA